MLVILNLQGSTIGVLHDVGLVPRVGIVTSNEVDNFQTSIQTRISRFSRPSRFQFSIQLSNLRVTSRSLRVGPLHNAKDSDPEDEPECDSGPGGDLDVALGRTFTPVPVLNQVDPIHILIILFI